ncbi:unnamed protein product [Schistosoma rodhaini]|uniref:Smad anchor for receptor activation-like C-terminal domain-containing protein n=1 Tax=Schistosoma rodhaini TaxID=6188 RepID=A0AA85GD94_9TREM|nr:unnamed protein product [Schistosoma rodhaini]
MSKSTTPSEEFGYPHLPVRQKSDQETISQCIKTLKSRRPNTLDFSPLALGNRDRNNKTYAKRPTVLSVHDSFQTAVCTCPTKRPNFLPIPSQGSKYPSFPKPSDGLISGNGKRIVSTVKASSPLNTRSVHIIHPDSMELFIKKNTHLLKYHTCRTSVRRRPNKCGHISTKNFIAWSPNNTQLYSVFCFDKFRVIHRRLPCPYCSTCSHHKRRSFNHSSYVLGGSNYLSHSQTFPNLLSFRRCCSYSFTKHMDFTFSDILTSSIRLCPRYCRRINNSVGTVTFGKPSETIEGPVFDSTNFPEVYDIPIKSSQRLGEPTSKPHIEKVTLPTTIFNDKNMQTINININDANHVFQQRIDPSLANTSLDENCSDGKQLHTFKKLQQIQPNGDIWPPLVINSHPELVLQFNPPVGLLISLLENTNKKSDYLYDKNVRELTIDSDKSSLDSVIMTPVTQSESSSKSDHVSPGITIALTRNLHVRVHPTELNCCLRQSAWCFSSSGFYQFGQEEIVILLRRRFDERLPPMEIFYQYWLIYQALVNYAEKQVKSDVNFESFNSQTYNRPFGSAPFRSHDCFFEKLYFANDRCSSSPCTDSDMSNGYCWLNSRSLTSSIYGSSNPYGFVFFHPTHQCLLGLHLPNPPFLIALLVHIQEAPWAYHLPSRILLNLGKMSHYYPTTLLSDRDRKILFDCKLDGESFLQLFTNIKPFIYPDFMTFTPKQRCIPLPELLFHINGFYAHLNVVKSESDTNITTHNNGIEDVIVELLIPMSSCASVARFLDSSVMESMTFALSADCNPMSDSHLVCSQSKILLKESKDNHNKLICQNVTNSQMVSNLNYFTDQNCSQTFETEAISIENTRLKVTGVSFVAFSGHARYCSAVIVEDGIYISMTSLKFHQLVSSLKGGHDLSIPIRSSCNIPPSAIVEHISGDFGDNISNRDLLNGNVASSVHVKWFKVFDSFLSSASFSTTVTPCYTNSASIWDLEPITTFLVPVHYQLWHWIHLNENIIPSSESRLSSLPTTKSSDPPFLRLAWIRFHVLNVDQVEFISTSSSKAVTFGHFSNEVAECVIKALRPYLGHLLNNNRTQITLRILLQPPDQVGYRMGASCQEVYTLHNQLDSSNDLENTSCENCEETYADALDDILLPVLSSWNSCLKIVDPNMKEFEQRRSPGTSDFCYHPNEIIQMEFDFCILN